MMISMALVRLLLLDIVSLGILLLLVLVLAMQRPVAYSVLKRNFYAYFANPTGYVFLCLFVLLTSMAAFFPYEFFNSNLGTLGQLNKWFTYIMLFFIPAITMSIWADERRQGTDELLLTLPATDFDIVIGKYIAAASIYTVSLLFSQFSTFIVLALLTQGDVDTGLFFSNYLGYWLIGLAAPWPALFAGGHQAIAWGSDRVLQQTLTVAAALGLQPILLPLRGDLDHAKIGRAHV